MSVVQPPAEPSMPLSAVDTPALVLDMDAFEFNLATMQEAVAGRVRLRPHAKTHKSAIIARKQMALGAVGVCAQKASEAEALVLAGVGDVLVANQVFGARKLRRLAAAARLARIGLCCDSLAGVNAAAEAVREAGTQLDIFIEIDAGGERSGIDVGPEVLRLAERVAAAPGLTLRGVQAYHGPSQHLRGFAEREAATTLAASRARQTREMLAGAGFTGLIVTGAGTGTFQFAAGSRVYDEIQPGSYVFMDADYARNLGQNNGPFAPFRHSLFVLTTVVSAPGGGRAIVDAGHKSVAVDSGMPVVFGRDNLTYARASDEAGLLTGADLPKVGDRILLVPSHCDPTVNLHDWYVCTRNGHVEGVWPVTARGMIH